MYANKLQEQEIGKERQRCESVCKKLWYAGKAGFKATAAPDLSDFEHIPQANCHELKHNRKGELAVDISGNHRIVFMPEHEPVPLKEDGGLDWEQVTKIKIVSIGEDYH